MLEYARLRPGPGFQPFRAGLYYGQRLAVGPWVRRTLARVVAAGVNAIYPSTVLPPVTAAVAREAENIVNDMSRIGFARLPMLLSPEQLAEVHLHLQGQLVAVRGRDGSRKEFALNRLPPGATSADLPVHAVLTCPHILALANHPLVLRIALRYLGCLPTISTIGIRWSLPGSGSGTDTQHFHRDPDDIRFFKLFIYLTDVDAQSAPHLFVKGSHLTSGRIFARRYDRNQIEQDYGAGSIAAITGPRGTTFVADTYGIHSGGVPRTQARVMLTVGYSTLPLFALKYRPLPVTDRPTVNRYINRLLLA